MKSLDLHHTLTSLLYQIERDGDIGPIQRILNDQDLTSLTRQQIAAWVETHSPFSFTKNEAGVLRGSKKQKKKPWRTAEAQRTPYWLATKAIVSKSELIVDNSNLYLEAKRVEENAFVRKHLKSAFDEFLKMPTQTSLATIVSQMNDYLNYGTTRQAFEAKHKQPSLLVSFVSGGLPSLGKHAK